MTYAYDPFGNLIQTTDPRQRGHRHLRPARPQDRHTDPDLGGWSYSYDTLDELVSQTDAKSQTTTSATTSSAAACSASSRT